MRGWERERRRVGEREGGTKGGRDKGREGVGSSREIEVEGRWEGGYLSKLHQL